MFVRIRNPSGNPLASIVPAETRSTWRDPSRSVPSLAAFQATLDARACTVEVSCNGQRLLARWSAIKPEALSIERSAVADAGEMLVHLRGTLASGAKAGVHFGSRLTARIARDDAFALECIARLFDPGSQRGKVSALFADALLRTLALHVFARYAPPVFEAEHAGDRLAPAHVRRLKSFIDARLERRLSRTDLARLAGYDAREFSIAFRNTFGMTPMQYVIERRLDRACLLIATTAHDLADIAISAGFSSQSHLTTTLKKRRGITPLRLRRQAARGTA
jgi:AraC-like DNA-binding protein